MGNLFDKPYIYCTDWSKCWKSLQFFFFFQHLSLEAHKRIWKLKKKSEQNIICRAIEKYSITVDLETKRIFRTAYHIGKMNRPFSDMTHINELQKYNGLDMGIILHSR